MILDKIKARGDELAMLQGHDRLQYLVDLAREVEPLDEKDKIEENKIVPIHLTFSSLIDTENSNSDFSIFQDSIPVEYDVEWINPLTAKILPKDNWIPDKT